MRDQEPAKASDFFRAKRKFFSAQSLTTLLLAATGQARAQALDRYFPANVPAYQDWIAAANPVHEDGAAEPQGVRLGNIILHPEVTERLSYDSSPFLGEPQGGSAVVNSTAAVSADSDWSRNSLDARLSVDDFRYVALPHRSFTNWTAAIGGGLDYADNHIGFGYAHLNTVTLPTSVASFAVKTAIMEQVDDLRLNDTIGTGRLQLVPQIVGQAYRFGAAPGSSGRASGGTASGGTFDHDAATASLTASYAFAGGHNLLAIFSDSLVQYGGGMHAQRPANYDDASVLLGLEYRQSAIFAYRVVAGYEDRTATGRGTLHGAITSPAAELDLIYRPTVLTTLTLKVARSLQNEPTELAQGLAETAVTLSVDHAYSRRVMLHLSAEYIRADFPSNGLSQSSTAASVSASWRLGRDVTLSAEYALVQTSGAGPGFSGFTRQQAMLGIRFER